MNKKELTAHIKSIQGKGKNEIFSLPLGEIKILPGYNRRIDYDLRPLIDHIKANGCKFPPLKLQIVDGDLYVDQGHRRTMASIEAGCDLATTRLDCYVDATENTERNFAERIADQISSNQGKSYTNMELMLVCRDLKEKYNWEAKEIYTRFGISQSKYSNLSKMFGLSNKLILAIDESKVNYTEIVDALRMKCTEAEIFEDIRAKIKYREELEAFKSENPDIIKEDVAIVEQVIDGEHIENTDLTNLDGRYVPIVTDAPQIAPSIVALKPPTPPKEPKWKKPDYRRLAENIVNLYEIDQQTDYVTIKIPVEDWQTIMSDIEGGKK